MAELPLLSPKPNTYTPVETASPARPRIAFGFWGLRFAAVIYLSVFILVPVFVIAIQGVRFGFDEFLNSITRPEAVFAIKLSVYTSVIMTIINTVIGTLTAYVLVRYRFPGKGIFNALIDLPFAIPTLVTGVMLVILYGPQTFIGSFFAKELHFKILFDTPGIIVALLLVGYPFVIRTVQPVLLQLDLSQSESAHTLGASEWTTFRRIIFPVLRPAIITGALLSFARSLGEFGSIIVVAGNYPMRSQTATVYIYTQVEAGNMQAASGVSLVLLAIAFIVTLSVDIFQWRRHHA